MDRGNETTALLLYKRSEFQKKGIRKRDKREKEGEEKYPY
jgi:hypothetical protein